MATNKHFLQDRTTLLLTSFELFLTLFTSVVILLRLNAAGGRPSFVTQFRALPDASSCVTGMCVNGTVWDIVSFIIAAFAIFFIGTGLSYRVYKLRRELSLTILLLSLILLLFLLAVSNILLIVR